MTDSSISERTHQWAMRLGLDLDLWLVGGAIRDELLGREPKDHDYLAAGASIEDIKRAAAPSCWSVSDLKVAERIVGVRCVPKGVGAAVEICPPRMEISTGPAHDDFEIVADPNASVMDDLKRRDFSCNAIARHLSDGRVFDPYGGIIDIEQGRLHVLRAESFRDDPLRLLRGFARISNDGCKPDFETKALMERWGHRLEHVSGERIGMELRKILGDREGDDLGGEYARLAFELMVETRIFGIAFPRWPPSSASPRSRATTT